MLLQARPAAAADKNPNPFEFICQTIFKGGFCPINEIVEKEEGDYDTNVPSAQVVSSEEIPAAAIKAVPRPVSAKRGIFDLIVDISEDTVVQDRSVQAEPDDGCEPTEENSLFDPFVPNKKVESLVSKNNVSAHWTKMFSLIDDVTDYDTGVPYEKVNYDTCVPSDQVVSSREVPAAAITAVPTPVSRRRIFEPLIMDISNTNVESKSNLVVQDRSVLAKPEATDEPAEDQVIEEDPIPVMEAKPIVLPKRSILKEMLTLNVIPSVSKEAIIPDDQVMEEHPIPEMKEAIPDNEVMEENPIPEMKEDDEAPEPSSIAGPNSNVTTLTEKRKPKVFLLIALDAFVVFTMMVFLGNSRIIRK